MYVYSLDLSRHYVLHISIGLTTVFEKQNALQQHNQNAHEPYLLI